MLNTLLRDGQRDGLQELHAELAHVAVPILMVVGWALFGPRRNLTFPCCRPPWRSRPSGRS